MIADNDNLRKREIRRFDTEMAELVDGVDEVLSLTADDVDAVFNVC